MTNGEVIALNQPPDTTCPHCVTGESKPCRCCVTEGGYTLHRYDWSVEEPTVHCRHKRGDCDRCGTTERRDVMHRTSGGRGVVGRLMKP